MDQFFNDNKNLLRLVFAGILLIFLYISQQNYLFFHTTAEGVSIVISFAVFIIAWNSRRLPGNAYIFVLGMAYLFIGILDYMHVMTYSGMTIFSQKAFYANQLWISARYFESLVILASTALIGKSIKLKMPSLLLTYGIVTSVVLFMIFMTDWFPVCYIEGLGQTPFKIISEYIIVIILMVSLWFLRANKESMKQEVYQYIFASIWVTILAELAFTLYTDLYGILNVTGHLFKIISFYCIYKAIVVTGIRDPYNSIFKELNDKNIEVTALLENIQASALRKDKLNQEKSRLLAVISHEMRTPLNGMYGILQLFRMTEVTEEQDEYLGLLERTSKSLRQMIDNILDIEKYLSGKMYYDDIEVQLKPLIDGDYKVFLAMCKEKGLDLEWHNALSLSTFGVCDGDKIKQIVNNLMANAIKFSSEGCIQFNCRAETFDDKLRLYIRVKDPGIGIEESEIKDLFIPFMQVGGNKKSTYGGTGLGLSICKEIANHYKGDIEVLSQPDVGSEFIVNLELDLRIKE